MKLEWRKCAGYEWCLLRDLDLFELNQFGVFVIWRNGDTTKVSAVLYVGRGHLRNELSRLRRDPLFQDSFNLRVTWAEITDVRLLPGIGAYLYQELRPMWGEIVPQTVSPILVNLPLSA